MKLRDLISRVESNDNPYAQRFEPAVANRSHSDAMLRAIKVAHDDNHCNWTTANIIASTSYGRYQIMGFNLYGTLGVTQPVIQWAADPAAQDAAFTKYCSLGGYNADAEVPLDDTAWLLKWAAYYNGPGDPAAYVQRLREEASKWTIIPLPAPLLVPPSGPPTA